MKVLCQGSAFFVGHTPLRFYEGPHEFRTLCAHEEFRAATADYWYDLEKDTISDILAKIGPGWRPDLILFWGPEDQVPPRGIEDCPVRTAAVVSDWNHVYPRIAGNLSRFDVVVCDRPGVDALRGSGVAPRYFGPVYSQNSSVHKPYSGEKDLDVVYIGGFNHMIRPGRGRFLARLAKLSGQYRILLAEGYFGEEYARLLSRARLVFNHGIRGEMNLRVFETMACGAVPLIEEGNREALEWLEDGRDAVFYNACNFEERIAHYLNEAERCEALRARALGRAADFAGENRIGPLAEWAVSEESGGRAFNGMEARERLFQEVMLHSFSWLGAVRRREAGLVARYAGEAPEDPRAWTAIAWRAANAYLNPYLSSPDAAAVAGPCRQAAEHAYTLAPGSAPYAFNAAWACGLAGDAAAEKTYLDAVLKAESLEGAALALGNVQDPFWTPWIYAVAEGRASLDMIHAEAHARLAVLAIQAGRRQDARRQADSARGLAQDHYYAARLAGELAWNTGEHAEGIRLLDEHLGRFPFDYAARKRFEEMLRAAGETDQADAFAKETRTLETACEAKED